LFITGVDVGMSMRLSNTKRDLQGGSPNLTPGKRLKINFNPATSKSALGHFATTTGGITMSPGTSSLPEINPGSQEALMREMQREKERL